eukprot:GHVT01088154.1.p1 GENE.GHVT01088154.1~~GHVT01088154.1.p1  ORF type:complete len:1441 (-),score=117.44 GHVT01088154.1:717-5039(-)
MTFASFASRRVQATSRRNARMYPDFALHVVEPRAFLPRYILYSGATNLPYFGLLVILLLAQASFWGAFDIVEASISEIIGEEPYLCTKAVQQKMCDHVPVEFEKTCHKMGLRWEKRACTKTKHELRCNMKTIETPDECVKTTTTQQPYPCAQTVSVERCKNVDVKVEKMCHKIVDRPVEYPCVQEHWQDKCDMVPGKEVKKTCYSTVVQNVPYECRRTEMESSCEMLNVPRVSTCHRTEDVQTVEDCSVTEIRYDCSADFSQRIGVIQGPPEDALIGQSGIESGVWHPSAHVGALRNLGSKKHREEGHHCRPVEVPVIKTCTRNKLTAVPYPCYKPDVDRVCKTVPRQVASTCYKAVKNNVPYECSKAKLEKRCMKVVVKKPAICVKMVAETEEYRCQETKQVRRCLPVQETEASTCYRTVPIKLKYNCLRPQQVEDCIPVPVQTIGECYDSREYREAYSCWETKLVEKCHIETSHVQKTCFKQVNMSGGKSVQAALPMGSATAGTKPISHRRSRKKGESHRHRHLTSTFSEGAGQEQRSNILMSGIIGAFATPVDKIESEVVAPFSIQTKFLGNTKHTNWRLWQLGVPYDNIFPATSHTVRRLRPRRSRSSHSVKTVNHPTYPAASYTPHTDNTQVHGRISSNSYLATQGGSYPEYAATGNSNIQYSSIVANDPASHHLYGNQSDQFHHVANEYPVATAGENVPFNADASASPRHEAQIEYEAESATAPYALYGHESDQRQYNANRISTPTASENGAFVDHASTSFRQGAQIEYATESAPQFMPPSEQYQASTTNTFTGQPRESEPYEQGTSNSFTESLTSDSSLTSSPSSLPQSDSYPKRQIFGGPRTAASPKLIQEPQNSLAEDAHVLPTYIEAEHTETHGFSGGHFHATTDPLHHSSGGAWTHHHVAPHITSIGLPVYHPIDMGYTHQKTFHSHPGYFHPATPHPAEFGPLPPGTAVPSLLATNMYGVAPTVLMSDRLKNSNPPKKDATGQVELPTQNYRSSRDDAREQPQQQPTGGGPSAVAVAVATSLVQLVEEIDAELDRVEERIANGGMSAEEEAQGVAVSEQLSSDRVDVINLLERIQKGELTEDQLMVIAQQLPAMSTGGATAASPRQIPEQNTMAKTLDRRAAEGQNSNYQQEQLPADLEQPHVRRYPVGVAEAPVQVMHTSRTVQQYQLPPPPPARTNVYININIDDSGEVSTTSGRLSAASIPERPPPVQFNDEELRRGYEGHYAQSEPARETAVDKPETPPELLQVSADPLMASTATPTNAPTTINEVSNRSVDELPQASQQQQPGNTVTNGDPDKRHGATPENQSETGTSATNINDETYTETPMNNSEVSKNSEQTERPPETEASSKIYVAQPSTNDMNTAAANINEREPQQSGDDESPTRSKQRFRKDTSRKISPPIASLNESMLPDEASDAALPTAVARETDN